MPAGAKNFLLGYGERLVEKLPPPPSKPSKAHPYSFAEAKERLAPRVRAGAQVIADLPPAACPSDEAVALVTLHPAYLAKTYFPNDFLRATGMEAVGSRAREVTPEKSTKKTRQGGPVVTAELYVAGPRKQFAALAQSIDALMESGLGAVDIVKIEDFRVQAPSERLKPIRTDAREPLLEIVLHAQPVPQYDFVIEGFDAYVRGLHPRVG